MFDLAQSDTWGNIPTDTDLIWCFPAAPIEQVRGFAKLFGAPPRRIVVLGSTSAYDLGESHSYPPPWIDETAPIDVSKPRVQGEEWLRKECGAIVLRVAGIYGPGRNPLDWIRQGRVAPSRKYVNLIHVEDLAAICLAALEQGNPGEVYNISDGLPRTWAEIQTTAEGRWGLAHLPENKTDKPGKRIDTRKLSNRLGHHIRHADLYTALDALERGNATSATAPSH
jgi:nucleoside-diphosphate-sugar epimerase